MIKSIIGFNNDWDAAYALVRAVEGQQDIGNAEPLSAEERGSELYFKLKAIFQAKYLGGLMQSEKPLISRKTMTPSKYLQMPALSYLATSVTARRKHSLI